MEDHTIAALRQLKQRNPNISTIFYHDSGRMWTNDQIGAWGRTGAQSTKLWNPTVYRADNRLVDEHPDCARPALVSSTATAWLRFKTGAEQGCCTTPPASSFGITTPTTTFMTTPTPPFKSTGWRSA